MQHTHGTTQNYQHPTAYVNNAALLAVTHPERQLELRSQHLSSRHFASTKHSSDQPALEAAHHHQATSTPLFSYSPTAKVTTAKYLFNGTAAHPIITRNAHNIDVSIQALALTLTHTHSCDPCHFVISQLRSAKDIFNAPLRAALPTPY